MIALMSAGTTVADELPRVVLVQYVVSESSATRVDELLTGSVERALHTLPRVSNIESNTRAGVGKVAADIEIHFEGGATKQDMALVLSRIAQAELGNDVQVTSVAVHLRVARYRPKADASTAASCNMLNSESACKL
ncbi:hypothetical protein [Massilia sp. Leaf139]|uniref:hypothetical protein n=1 Tax=Massilia sp. Leaf139 TaxID=1736272 RepID=UPI0012E79715|nr:hypothetical protein [Massilia sp. Leaf139]